MEGDGADPELALGVFGKVADGLVLVALDLKAVAGGDVEEGEHVATGDGGDEGFLGIEVGRVGPGRRNDGGGRGGREGEAAVEGPVVFAGVLAFEEVGAGAGPADGGEVLGHARERVAKGMGRAMMR